MERFFFHLVGPDGFAEDADGCLLKDLDTAYLEAYRAALDMSFEMLARRCDPRQYSFQICGPHGAVVMEVPFREALLSRTWKPPLASEAIGAQIAARRERSAALTADINGKIVAARRSLLALRETLSKFPG